MVNRKLILATLALMCAVEGMKMLFLGDLVAKRFVSDWCDSKQSLFGTNFYSSRNTSFSIQLWGGNLSMDASTGASYCHEYNSGDLVAFAYIYGSSDSGPYYRHPTKEIAKNPQLIKTKDRVELALKEYISTFNGLPDKIIVQTSIMDYLYASEKVLFNKIFDSSQPQWNDVLDKLVVDFKSFDDKNSKWKDMITSFEKNTRARVSHLKDLVQKLGSSGSDKDSRTLYDRSVRKLSLRGQSFDSGSHQRSLPAVAVPEIGTFTTLWFELGNNIIREFNHILRNISVTTQVTLYDLDYDVWSKVHFKNTLEIQKKLFGMSYYPDSRFAESTVDILLGKQHSSYYAPGGKHLLNAAKSVTEEGMERKNIRLVRAHSSAANNDSLPGTGEIFYCNFVDGVRYKYRIGNLSHLFPNVFGESSAGGMAEHHEHTHEKGSSPGATSAQGIFFASQLYEDFMRATLESVYLSSADMLLLPEKVLETIPTSTEFMPILFSSVKNLGFTSPNKYDSTVTDLFISYAETGKYKQIPYFALYDVYKVAKEDIFYNIARHWFASTPPDMTGINVYKDDTLLRYFSDRSVYVIKGGVKYSFSNGNAFARLGYDFDNVIVLSQKDKAYFDMIPYGGRIA